MGGNPAAAGNAIAQASLDESKRQYNEQQEKEKAQKARAKANANAVREGANVAYSHSLQQTTNISATDPGQYSLINTAFGTPSVLNTLMGGGDNKADVLGG